MKITKIERAIVNISIYAFVNSLLIHMIVKPLAFVGISFLKVLRSILFIQSLFVSQIILPAHPLDLFRAFFHLPISRSIMHSPIIYSYNSSYSSIKVCIAMPILLPIFELTLVNISIPICELAISIHHSIFHCPYPYSSKIPAYTLPSERRHLPFSIF